METAPKPPPLDYHAPPYDPQARLWRMRRGLFRIGLFVVLSPIAFYFGPNLINFGKLTRLTPADFAPDVERLCVPTVRAMKEYRRDTGKWPSEMEDLVPRYLATKPSRQSINDGGSSGTPSFMCFVAPGSHFILYDFTPGSEGWAVHGGFAWGPVPVPPVTIPASSGPAPK